MGASIVVKFAFTVDLKTKENAQAMIAYYEDMRHDAAENDEPFGIEVNSHFHSNTILSISSTEEYGDTADLIELMACVEGMGLSGTQVVEYAVTCDKLQGSGFGGGAIAFTYDSFQGGEFGGGAIAFNMENGEVVARISTSDFYDMYATDITKAPKNEPSSNP